MGRYFFSFEREASAEAATVERHDNDGEAIQAALIRSADLFRVAADSEAPLADTRLAVRDESGRLVVQIRILERPGS